MSRPYEQDESDMYSRPRRKVGEEAGTIDPTFGTQPGPTIGAAVLRIAAA